MTKEVLNKTNLFKITFILFFIFIWISLDTNFENVYTGINEFKVTNFILLSRSVLPFVLFFLICIFAYKYKKISIRNFFKKQNIYYYIFFFYLFIQLIGHSLADNKFIFTYYFYLSFFLLIYIYFASSNNLLHFSFYLSLFILIILFSIFAYLSIKYFITNGDLHFYGTFPNVYKSILTVSTNVIRSSGLSRTTMLIYIPLFLYLLLTPISKKKFLINFLLIFIILLTQSRLTNIFWIIFIFFSFYWYMQKNRFNIYLKKFLTLIVIPFLITGGIISTKYYLVKNNILLTDDKNIIVGLNIFNEVIIGENDFYTSDEDVSYRTQAAKIIRIVDPSTLSSGRVEYWKQILKKNNNYLLGNGFLGDRHLIENNASNIMFYAYASAGFIGSFLLIILILRCIFLSLDLMFFKKVNFDKKNIIVISSIFYLGFLTFRGIGENSYAIFSIDQIIFLQSLMILEEHRKKLLKI